MIRSPARCSLAFVIYSSFCSSLSLAVKIHFFALLADVLWRHKMSSVRTEKVFLGTGPEVWVEGSPRLNRRRRIFWPQICPCFANLRVSSLTIPDKNFRSFPHVEVFAYGKSDRDIYVFLLLFFCLGLPMAYEDKILKRWASLAFTPRTLKFEETARSSQGSPTLDRPKAIADCFTDRISCKRL